MNHMHKIVIIGAGPAGLTAAYQLTKKNISLTVVEGDSTYVGGLSRTVDYKGFHIDIGGHRFFSKSQIVEDLWTEILRDDLIVRERISRIYYRGKFYSYPLNPIQAFLNLGPLETTICVVSYLKAKLFPKKNPRSFQDWVTNQFGKRLFRIFFETYTEKVWGMSCRDISADWAAQRIGKLSLGSAILNSFRKLTGHNGKQKIKTLIETFRYPRKGPGQMWKECAERIKKSGGEILMGHVVQKCNYDEKNKIWKIEIMDSAGRTRILEASHVISSAPLRELANSIQPGIPSLYRETANMLKYRDFLCIALILKTKEDLPDQWIYIHDPSVKVGRIQNFKSWSPEMVPNPELTCYGLEYFCFENDNLWSMRDDELITFAKNELEKLGLAKSSDIYDGLVIRQKKAYPVYDDDYAKHVGELRRYLEHRFPSLYLIGRNGMHKYNNQDHAMMTAILTVENIIAGYPKFDPWKVNQDAEYIEDGPSSTSGLRLVPLRLKESVE